MDCQDEFDQTIEKLYIVKAEIEKMQAEKQLMEQKKQVCDQAIQRCKILAVSSQAMLADLEKAFERFQLLQRNQEGQEGERFASECYAIATGVLSMLEKVEESFNKFQNFKNVFLTRIENMEMDILEAQRLLTEGIQQLQEDIDA
ncbi:hypothetical protein WMY93_009113 [Mugilogobius chulae]|uniref:Uncharacterized protein n=1 Tax=Mugilogobius chulae TaxID=88201 RepID=A0AAW0PAH8_9GOBI